MDARLDVGLLISIRHIAACHAIPCHVLLLRPYHLPLIQIGDGGKGRCPFTIHASSLSGSPSFLPSLPLSLEVVSLFTLDAAALSTETIRMTGATKVHSEEERKGKEKEGQKASLSEMHFVD